MTARRSVCKTLTHTVDKGFVACHRIDTHTIGGDKVIILRKKIFLEGTPVCLFAFYIKSFLLIVVSLEVKLNEEGTVIPMDHHLN